MTNSKKMWQKKFG